MRFAFRSLLTVALVLCAAAGTRAQQFSNTSVFTFAPAPVDVAAAPKADANTDLRAKAELKLRPNATTEVYAWVLNPTDDKDDFIVEVKGPKGVPTARSAKISIPGNTWVRVKLPKPAAPAPIVPPPPAVVVGDPKQPPAPAPEPPPPGVELVPNKGDVSLTFRLLDKNGGELKDDAGKQYGKTFPVAVLSPEDYVNAPVATVSPGKGVVGVRMTVSQNKTFAYPGSAAVQFVVPPQDALTGAVIREGFYRRTLTFDPKEPEKAAVTLAGTIEGASEKARVYVGVDGIDRAFPFILNPLGKTPATQLLPNTRPAVRVSLVSVGAKSVATQPVAKFPVLIEVDNATPDDRLELRLQPVGASKELAEVVKFEALRDVRVWLDADGPTDGGLLFTTKSRDWVKPLDLSHLRGKVEITGVLETKDRFVFSEPILVTVDATAPERIAFLPVPPKLEKGQPLPVSAVVNDPDTDVVKATFYLFKNFEDGKIPAAAIKAEGSPTPKDASVWAADLKVPDDFRGAGLVAVVFTNSVGLASDPPKVQKVEIVEVGALAKNGKVVATVEFGGRPQPGVQISLRDADNKEKGAGLTNEKGQFTFDNVPPGNYLVAANKKDSSTGASGSAPVKVEAEKTAKPTVSMSKNKQ